MTATMSVPGTYDKEADQVVWTDGYVAPHASDDVDAVSYTHLTLPTIYSV